MMLAARICGSSFGRRWKPMWPQISTGSEGTAASNSTLISARMIRRRGSSMLKLQLVAEELQRDRSQGGTVHRTRTRHHVPHQTDASKQTRQPMLDRIKGDRRGRREDWCASLPARKQPKGLFGYATTNRLSRQRGSCHEGTKNQCPFLGALSSFPPPPLDVVCCDGGRPPLPQTLVGPSARPCLELPPSAG